jgi:hypothetical protein
MVPLLKIKNSSGSDVATLGLANGFNSTGSVSTLLVTGDVNLNDTLRVTGDLYANGDLFVTQSLTVNGETTLGGSLRVAGPIYSTGTMYSHYINDGPTTRVSSRVMRMASSFSCLAPLPPILCP